MAQCILKRHKAKPTVQSDSLQHRALQVARRSFVKALDDKRSVLFVPGGQAELVHTHRASAASREWVVYTGHKGALRGPVASAAVARWCDGSGVAFVEAGPCVRSVPA